MKIEILILDLEWSATVPQQQRQESLLTPGVAHTEITASARLLE
jgi:hypothetical protein